MTKKELEQKLVYLEQQLKEEKEASDWLCGKSSEDDQEINKLNTVVACLVNTIEQLNKEIRELRNGN